MVTFEFPLCPDHIRTFKVPTQRKIRIVHALVAVDDLPLHIPLDPDPRVPRVKGPITTTIKRSVASNDGRFHLLNRGITMSAKEVEFDSRHAVLKMSIPDGDAYGIIDGAHTYHAITTSVDSRRNGHERRIFPNQYVHLEILEGIENHLADIAEARNFSVQLKAWTIANHPPQFDWH